MINSRSVEAQTHHLQVVAAPYPLPRSSLLILLRQYVIVLLAHLSSYRRSWVFQTFLSLIVPFALIFAAKSLLSSVGSDRAVFLLGGDMTMSIAFGPTVFLINKLGWAHHNREFDYWVALPVPKLIVVVAIISMALLFALPGLLGSYIFGSLLLGLPLSEAWALIFLIPLGVLPLAGIGAFLGTAAPNGQTASLMGDVLLVAVGFLSPMFIPPEQLPAALQITALCIPTTYVADAFRSVISAHFGLHFVVDLVVLLLCSAGCLIFAHWKLEWRTV